MPELPEVEDAAQRLRNAMVGQRISSVDVFHPSIARTLTKGARRQLTGRTVTSVSRRAKIQLVSLDDGRLLEVHFRMTGDWEIGRAGDPVPALERARITCDDGTRVSFVDARAFGVLRLHEPGAFELPALGPEPLDAAFDTSVLAEALAPRRGPIKPVLLDQRVVAGLGNIYAAEALWVARIRPDVAANSLSRARVARLRDAIQLVLREATGGRYYERGGGERGGWRVYDREGAPCPRCSARITRVVQAGRSTYCCRRCQR